LLLALLTAFGCKFESKTPADQDSSGEDTSSAPFTALDSVIGLHEKWIGGLDSMIERRRIRALVPYSRMHYYVDGTERSGLSYDAMQALEAFINERIDSRHRVQIVFIPTTRDQLLPSLLQGYGDIIATGLTNTPQRQQVVDFSTPLISNTEEIIVSGPTSRLQRDTTALLQTPIYVRSSSSYYEHLMEINDSLAQLEQAQLNIRLLDEQVEDEHLLAMVDEGLIPATLIERNLAEFWSQTLDGLQLHENHILFRGGEVGYAIRKDSPKLKALLDQFVRQNRKGTLMGNILFNRYLQDTSYLAKAYSTAIRERILLTRDLFVKYGKQYELDWLILAALGYQESRLQQSVKSAAGAVGIMQVRPTTAMDPNVNISNIYNLEENIHAGTKYLRYLIDHHYVHPDIDSLNAGLFALAAYNAGPYRIAQLRKAAARQGYDANIWFNNVEIIAAQQIGQETVQYVSNIFKFYTSYRALFRYTKETGVEVFAGLSIPAPLLIY
jgi:membrane-bound lytic murein transglycosylase MltF